MLAKLILFSFLTQFKLHSLHLHKIMDTAGITERIIREENSVNVEYPFLLLFSDLSHHHACGSARGGSLF